MDFTQFVRRPFTVEAVLITEDNLEEIAQFVGTIARKGDGTRFIKVDRRLVPNLTRVFPGFWMTRLDDKIRCYSPKAFREQFVASDADIMSWVDFLRADAQTPVAPEVVAERPEPDVVELPQPVEELPQPVEVNVFGDTPDPDQPEVGG